MSTRRIKVVWDGRNPRTARVLDADTGDVIPFVQRVEIDLSVREATVNLTVLNVEIDIEAEATVETVPIKRLDRA